LAAKHSKLRITLYPHILAHLLDWEDSLRKLEGKGKN